MTVTNVTNLADARKARAAGGVLQSWTLNTDEFAPEFRRGDTLYTDDAAELVEGCWVMAWLTSRCREPFLSRWRWTGRDYDGRFVPKGSENETFILDDWGIRCKRALLQRVKWVSRPL